MLPLMADAFSGLTQQIQFAIINSNQDNFDIVETIKTVNYFQGSLQPLHPRMLLIKPEGERRWKWWQLWTHQEIPVGNYIRDTQGLQYKVMSKSDWSQAGYQEYQIVQSATVGSNAL
jgi:hypothetical protein